MLDSLKKRPGALRWAPRQRFNATETGKSALASYEEALGQLRASGHMERGELEKLQSDWAGRYGISAADASVLGEFSGKDRLPREVQQALDDCGLSLSDVQAAVDRLFTAGLLAPTGGGSPIAPGERKNTQG